MRAEITKATIHCNCEEMKEVIRTIVVENHIQLQKDIAIHLKLDKIDEEDMSMKRQNTVSNLAELIYKNI